jgi:outer membrane protein TolC
MMNFLEDNKKLSCLWIVILLFIAPGNIAAEDLIGKGEKINLDRGIAIALKKHPQIRAAEHNLEASQSKIGQSRAGYYPQIKWSTGFSRNSSPLKSAPYNDYSSSVTLNQNIFDFNRVGTQVDIQTINLESSRADLIDTVQKIILGVKHAYYERLRAGRIRDINDETVKQLELHLETAKGFFSAGAKPKFDVTKAEVDLSNARLNLLKAENTLRINIAALNNALGISAAPLYDVEEDLAYQKYTAGDLDSSLKKAYLNRPDLRSLLWKKEAAQRSVALAKKDYYPVLSGSAGYGWSGEKYPLENGWNIGASLNFDLFSGFSTKYQIEAAVAALDVLKANEESLRQTIRLEVEQSLVNIQEADKRILTAEISVKQAEENLDLAQGRYAAGVGNPLEVTDALLAQGTARTALSGALYDHKIAEANLEKAVGEGAK